MKKVDETEPLAIGGFDYDSPCSIAEDDAGGAIAVIDDRRHHIRANHKDALVRSSLDELSTCLECIQKAGASGGDIKSPRVLAAEFVLHHARGGGKKHVGSHSPNHDR